MNFKRLGRLLALLAVTAAAPAVQAQQYPSKPIRLIVPYAAGGATDIVARIIQPKLSEALGQMIVVDNRGGNASIIGTALAAKAAPDGYNILMISSAFSINASLVKDLPYDSMRDFTPVVMVDIAPLMLVVHPVLPVNSVQDLIRLAKSKPGKLNFGAAGVGTGSHLGAAMFKNMAGVDILEVPYKGIGPALIDLLSGYTPLAFSPLLPVIPQVKSGKLKALAVTSIKRLPEMPDVPAVAETVPGYEILSTHGVLAPARTPQTIVQRLNTEIGKVLKLPTISKSLSDQGLQAMGGHPEVFASHIAQDIKKFGAIIKQLGLQAEAQ